MIDENARESKNAHKQHKKMLKQCTINSSGIFRFDVFFVFFYFCKADAMFIFWSSRKKTCKNERHISLKWLFLIPCLLAMWITSSFSNENHLCKQSITHKINLCELCTRVSSRWTNTVPGKMVFSLTLNKLQSNIVFF